MFRTLKLLFSRKDTKISISPSSAPVIEKKAVTEYFQEELDSCPFIKKECHNIVMKHLCHEVSLVKTDNKLTAEEKKAIGLNPSQAITKELVAVLTKEGLRNKNPKGILADIYNKATITKLRDEVIPPFLTELKSRYQATMANFCFGVMPPSPILGRSLL